MVVVIVLVTHNIELPCLFLVLGVLQVVVHLFEVGFFIRHFLSEVPGSLHQVDLVFHLQLVIIRVKLDLLYLVLLGVSELELQLGDPRA